jgi:(S)-mandelate dehydrogenase
MCVSTAINIEDLRERARRRLPRVVFDYLDGGAEDEATLDGNRAAFRRWTFVPRVLPGSGSVDLTIELFGERLALPLIVGPTGLNGIFWRRADVLLARAAGAVGAAFTLSTASNSSLEDVAAAGPGGAGRDSGHPDDRQARARPAERLRARGPLHPRNRTGLRPEDRAGGPRVNGRTVAKSARDPDVDLERQAD